MWKWLAAAASSIAAIGGVLDIILPASTMISSFRIDDKHTLHYGIPRSGGELAHCDITPALSQQLQGQRQISLKVSAIFGRCIAIQGLSQAEQACRQRRIIALIDQARTFEKLQELSYAQQSYALACHGQIDLPEATAACEASTKLSDTLAQDQVALLSYLESYKQNHQHYPESLTELSQQLPPLLNQRVANFSYCRKTRAHDHSANCSDGSVSYANAEIGVHPKILKKPQTSDWSPDQDQAFCLRGAD